MYYSVIVWNNSGIRREEVVGTSLEKAKVVAKTERTKSNRTVKIGFCSNTIYHWSRSVRQNSNHWSRRATADEFFV